MLIVANDDFVLSVVMLNVVMLSVVVRLWIRPLGHKTIYELLPIIISVGCPYLKSGQAILGWPLVLNAPPTFRMNLSLSWEVL